MSRSPTVQIQLLANVTEAEQQFEAFVRKAESRKIRLGFEGAQGGAPGTGGPTTFANASTAGTSGGGLESQYREAIIRRIASEQALSEANNRLALVTKSNAVERSEGWFGSGGGGGGGGVGRPTSVRSTARRDIDYSETGPDASFNSALNSLERQERRAQAAHAREEARARKMADSEASGPLLGRLGRTAAYALAGEAGGRLLLGYQQEGIEERLSVDRSGQVNLARQLAAERRIQQRIETVPIVGPIAGAVTEYFTGIGEETSRTEQEAARQTAATEGLRQWGVANRRQRSANVVGFAGERGQFKQERVRAEMDRYESYQSAMEEFNKLTDLDPSQSGVANKRLKEASDEIENAYKVATRANTIAYGVAYRGVAYPQIALKSIAEGRVRAGEREGLEEQIRAEVDNEKDPDLKRERKETGRFRLSAYDATRSRDDAVTISALQAEGEAARLQRTGDEAGAFAKRQEARRITALGPKTDDPTRPAREKAIKEGEDLESKQFIEERYFRRESLTAERDVTARLADRRPVSAEGESIYRRGLISAEESQKIGRPGEARIQLETTRNQLAALKNELELGGSATAVAAGTIGPGGTEGRGPNDENTAKAIGELKTSIDNLNSTMSKMQQD